MGFGDGSAHLDIYNDGSGMFLISLVMMMMSPISCKRHLVKNTGTKRLMPPVVMTMVMMRFRSTFQLKRPTETLLCSPPQHPSTRPRIVVVVVLMVSMMMMSPIKGI